MPEGEIRQSTKMELLEKVRRNDYGKYLLKVNLVRARGFFGEDVTFQFPVTALIGPNGSGKSSVLGAAACAYKSTKPGVFFPKSTIGDETMSGWRIEYELIDKTVNARQLVKRTNGFRQAKWVRGEVLERDVLFFGIERTVPAGEKPRYRKLTRSTYQHGNVLRALEQGIADQVKHILGRSVSDFRVTNLTHDDTFFVGKNREHQYSEFHFGAGESSIIRMISAVEAAPQNSLVLIEEIENGLHPVATRRMVEYLIDASRRKSLQAIFTTHSDYALEPLPNEAIWACIDGKVRQGKLSVEALRAVAGRVDRKLAIFTEDVFAKTWVDAILRERLGPEYEQVAVYAVAGDGNAITTHLGHSRNPAVTFKSLCALDGDSGQQEDWDAGVVRLPGRQPELTVYEDVRSRLDRDAAILTVSCQRPPEAQESVRQAIEEVIHTNRDPHLLFSQLGVKIGFVPEAIVRGAFLALWVRHNTDYCAQLEAKVRDLLRRGDVA